MSKVFQILCLSKNANLIKFLDEFSYLKVADNQINLTKLLLHSKFNFIILDHDLIEDSGNVWLGTIRDTVERLTNILIFSPVEHLGFYVKNPSIDDFITNPFSSEVMKTRLELLYNKRSWAENNEPFFFFSEEVRLFSEEIATSLNRIQLYFSTILENTTQDKELPAGLLLNIKKINLFVKMIFITLAKNIENEVFSEVLENAKDILILYDIGFNLIVDKDFSFSSLNFITRKTMAVFLILSILAGIIEEEKIEVQIDCGKDFLKILLNYDILSQNLFSSILLKRFLEKMPNVHYENRAIWIKKA